MIALSILLDPRPLADDEICGNFTFLKIGDFILDVPIDMG
jgi:hypothetical protein